MPPAFVLSQDQTLRKTVNYFIRIIWLALNDFFRDTLLSSQVNFKVHIALFNFQSAFQTVVFDGSLIYHSFSHLSSWIFKIFKTFLKFWFSFNFHFLRSSAPEKCRFHNISHFKQFFKSTLKDFSKFFYQPRLINWSVELKYHWRFPNIHRFFGNCKSSFEEFWKKVCFCP